VRKRFSGKEKKIERKKSSNQFVVNWFHHHIFAWLSLNTKLVQFNVTQRLIGMGKCYLLCASLCSSSGHRINLSSVATMAVKAGLWARSFCQQSNMRLWMASGQSIGAGNLPERKTNKKKNMFRDKSSLLCK
jgi:hypothetical protein